MHCYGQVTYHTWALILPTDFSGVTLNNLLNFSELSPAFNRRASLVLCKQRIKQHVGMSMLSWLVPTKACLYPEHAHLAKSIPFYTHTRTLIFLTTVSFLDSDHPGRDFFCVPYHNSLGLSNRRTATRIPPPALDSIPECSLKLGEPVESIVQGSLKLEAVDTDE